MCLEPQCLGSRNGQIIRPPWPNNLAETVSFILSEKNPVSKYKVECKKEDTQCPPQACHLEVHTTHAAANANYSKDTTWTVCVAIDFKGVA